MDTLAANLSQYLDLVDRDSPKKQKVEHSSILLMKACSKEKKKTPIHQQVRESC